MKRSFAEEDLSETEIQRFREISIPGYERIGAPRFGHDDAANEWILKARKAKEPEEVAAVLKEFEGYYVVRLVKCDGVPEYSNGGLYDGADETSFRGAFLKDCTDSSSERADVKPIENSRNLSAIACLRQLSTQNPARS